MTREIKFRGKYQETKEWVYGYLYRDESGTYIKPGDNNKRFGCGYPVIAATVGQYTGLKNKNGKEMYEGDIIAFERERNFKIEHIMPMQIEWSDYGNGMVGWSQCSPIDMFVVIGNIHDNIELLKAK